jgi:hypothetical protein
MNKKKALVVGDQQVDSRLDACSEDGAEKV